MKTLYNQITTAFSTKMTKENAVTVDIAKIKPSLVQKTNTWRKMTMTIIEDLYKINQDIVSTSLDYSIKKMDLKKKEADLLLKTNFEEVLGKSRPTVGDKEAYITLQTEELKLKVDEAEMNLDGLKRLYSIKKLEAKMTGNFLNTLAGVVDNDE